MTDTTAPDAITQARAAEMLALAPLQPAQPPKDRVFYARQHVPMKWTPYKPTSQEVKRGKKGRWQQRRAYGLGWENADEEPQAGAWIEDVINDPDRRLAAHGAGEGLREACREAIAATYGPECEDEWAAVDNLADRLIALLTPPTDAGSTTREGEEGVPAGMKPWAGGDAAPADWDGGRVLFRDGTLSVQAPQWVWRWKQPPYFRDIVAYTAKATTSSPDASPDSGEEQ